LIGSTIAKRYARAFFEIALEEKQLEQYYKELSGFAAIISDIRILRSFWLIRSSISPKRSPWSRAFCKRPLYRA